VSQLCESFSFARMVERTSHVKPRAGGRRRVEFIETSTGCLNPCWRRVLEDDNWYGRSVKS